VHYGLPDIPGVAELWGTKVFHCPYCHGWEVRDRRLAVHGCGEKAVHQALLLTSLSKDVVLCAGTAMTADHVRRLGAAGIDVRTEHIERVEEGEHGLRVVLQEHPPIERDALFIQPKLALPNDLARSLGADITDTGSVVVDATGESRIPGLFVAGDAGTAVQSVAVATGSGARAAYAINAALATNTETRTSEV
jgi:thioredoxin reductase